MRQRREKLKKFKVYYFVGDYWSSSGEEERSVIIKARTEEEAKLIFKSEPPKPCDSFGWVEEI